MIKIVLSKHIGVDQWIKNTFELMLSDYVAQYSGHTKPSCGTSSQV